MKVLLFQSHIQDKKHGLEFDKDRVSYRHRNFDAIIAKDFKPVIADALKEKGLKYPLELDLNDDTDYFLKPKKFKKADGTEGTKMRITIMGCQSIAQGKFESQTLDQLCDIYDNEMQDVDED